MCALVSLAVMMGSDRLEATLGWCTAAATLTLALDSSVRVTISDVSNRVLRSLDTVMDSHSSAGWSPSSTWADRLPKQSAQPMFPVGAHQHPFQKYELCLTE